MPAGSSHVLPAWWRLRRGDDDIVQAWTAPAALAAARSGKPSVFVFQGVLHENDLVARPRVRALLERVARECDVVTAYSDVAAAEFERLIGHPAVAIEPGIRLDKFTPAEAAAGEAASGGSAQAAHSRHPHPAIFCAADPDEDRKRVPLLVEAFKRVRAEHQGAELWLMNTSNPAIASAPGVRIIDPRSDQDELIRLYRSAWVTVLPAFREAFGLVVVESLACGTPVIGMTDGGAVPGILTPRDTDWSPSGPTAPVSDRSVPGGRVGCIADPDPEALAAVLGEAIASPPDAATAAACRTRAEDFSIERCAERYRALYREMLAR